MARVIQVKNGFAPKVCATCGLEFEWRKKWAYDPKKRVGEDACPFTTLYWNFLIEHRPEFSTNHRMAQQLAGIDRLSDVTELQVRAKHVLKGLDRGEI